MKKTWNVINELSSRNVSKTKRITQLDFEEREITAPEEMVETFNSYFSVLAKNLFLIFLLLCVIQHFILNQLINLSDLSTPSVNTVYQMPTTLDNRKSAGLDNIPNKFLKIAASAIAPSLTGIFTAFINTGIFPYEWKTSRVTPVFEWHKK